MHPLPSLPRPHTPAPPRLYVISGAGLSAESGIATFRDKAGTWANFDPNRLANLDTWKDHRAEVFEFYGARLAELQAVKPNDAHARLAAWQTRWGPSRVHLLTQNVDNLLEAAGATAVTHLHGDLRDLWCTACEHPFRPPIKDYGPALACPMCGQADLVKPGVIFFNERAPAYEAISTMQDALRPQDIVLVIGTSMMVLSVEQLLPRRRFGSPLNWQLNPEPDRLEWFAVNERAPASEGLARIEGRLVAAMDGLVSVEPAGKATAGVAAVLAEPRPGLLSRLGRWLLKPCGY